MTAIEVSQDVQASALDICGKLNYSETRMGLDAIPRAVQHPARHLLAQAIFSRHKWGLEIKSCTGKSTWALNAVKLLYWKEH